MIDLLPYSVDRTSEQRQTSLFLGIINKVLTINLYLQEMFSNVLVLRFASCLFVYILATFSVICPDVNNLPTLCT